MFLDIDLMYMCKTIQMVKYTCEMNDSSCVLMSWNSWLNRRNRCSEIIVITMKYVTVTRLVIIDCYAPVSSGQDDS